MGTRRSAKEFDRREIDSIISKLQNPNLSLKEIRDNSVRALKSIADSLSRLTESEVDDIEVKEEAKVEAVTEAVETAAIDATSKADAAESAAISTAASDATAKADAAEIAAIAAVPTEVAANVAVTDLLGTPFDAYMLNSNDGTTTVNALRPITLNGTWLFEGSASELLIENNDTVRLKAGKPNSRWLVIGQVSTYLSSGSTRSQSFCDLERALNGTQGGLAGASLFGTTGWIYNREIDEGFGTATVMYVIDLTPGDGLRLRAGRSTGDATNIRVHDAGTRFLWIKIKNN